jgi:Ca2+/Na+ antiporter
MNKSKFVVTVMAGVIALGMIMSTIMTSDILADSMFHISDLDNKPVSL